MIDDDLQVGQVVGAAAAVSWTLPLGSPKGLKELTEASQVLW
jgi:hypothetical protein